MMENVLQMTYKCKSRSEKLGDYVTKSVKTQKPWNLCLTLSIQLIWMCKQMKKNIVGKRLPAFRTSVFT